MKGTGWAAVQKIPCKSLIKLYEAKSNRAARRESRGGSRAWDTPGAGPELLSEVP